MARKSKQSDWTEMCGDINWEDYGGSWGRKLRDGVWFVLRFTNMEDACGDAEPFLYHCDVLQVDLSTLPEAELKSALQCCGFSFDEAGNVINDYDGDMVSERGSDHYEQVLVECCVSYGCYAPLDEVTGNSYPLRVRAQARRIADDLMHNQFALDARLDRPVNAIGSTAREFGKGDLNSAMERAATPKAELVQSMTGGTIKQIRQKDLSSECWLIQAWGPGQCESCEAYGTPECGGQEILKTKHNDKGIEVKEHGI